MDDKARKRLAALRAALADAHETLKLGFAFRLWDGTTVPANWPADGLRIAVAEEGVFASLLRRPKLDTLIEAHVAGRIELENGTIFDLAKARPEGKTGRLARKLSKLKLLKAAGLFLLAPKEARRGLGGIEDDASRRSGKAETNQENISYHYDVSNAFYRLFLDDEMVYTCAYYQPDWHDDLDRAQRDKLDMICRKLRLKPGDRFLDIGSGWGALICHAAQHYGVHATGVTLSKEQLAHATEKAARLGLSDRVTVELKDYRALDREFDKIASIGMFEHVGIDNHAAYFATINKLLRPRGLYLHHAISRPAKGDDKAFRKMRPEYKALVRYIFPGGELDHLGMSIANMERAKLEVHDVEGWREHYARTTRIWFERLHANRAAAEAEVGPEKTRMWLLYLAGCSLAFERSAVGIFQTLVSKRHKGPAGLPPSRADLYETRDADAPAVTA
ncbi:cyclopropane-fatty-acyl-phospholipid synthase [Alsobacter metallidurans]|uniref:Cyclopropane-fatty-acyl-phospholipid synthase n=1 Tax=Alsobacter metallidurans TaxID=340221 RepID=A0A917IBT5_9HYPH|nr:cyclopropane-fatty-acyl-phospholipid synthase family protein [Alsobacter metallidurans]GGH33009.1 cyclopropane-fatty-acyl-phospholipid synthase [Alsobacter metallidurans]